MSEITTARRAPKVRNAVVAAAIGNFIEWFDFGAYGFLAAVLAKVFFPLSNSAAGLLATFAVFGVAFLMNPLGGLFFGALGDRIGRKKVLVVVVGLMSLSTMAVGLLPGYRTLGIAAPIMLVALRILQGFSAGGEPGGAATFLVEFARPGRRARTVSCWHCSSYLANAAASVLVLLLNAQFTPEEMVAWGWRIPFLIAGPLGLAGLYLRLRLSDTPEFEELREAGEVSEAPIREAFRTNWRQILQVAGCIALQAAAFYFVFVYLETYIQSELGFSALDASVSTVICLVCAAASIFVFAAVSDRFGRKPVLLAGAAACTLTAYPVLWVLHSGPLVTVIIGHALLGVCLAAFMSASSAALVEIFPTRVRFGGFSVGFNVSVALFGGTAPYLATYLISATKSPLSPAMITVGTGLLAFATTLTLRETAGRRLDAPRMSTQQAPLPSTNPAGTP